MPIDGITTLLEGITTLIALLRFTVGGLLIGFPKSNAPKVRKVSESVRIMTLKQRILGEIN